MYIYIYIYIHIAADNMFLGHFHYKLAKIQSTISLKRTHLLLAKSYSEEVVRIETKIHNPTASLLVIILSELSTV
jgi:hypothetical protein